MFASIGIFITIIVVGSLVTTSVAIFQILNNDFNGSKGLWILISLIGFIGPILYLTHGRKLIVKKQTSRDEEVSFSLKKYYSGLLHDLSKNVKVVFVLAGGLVVIGYCVRLFDIYIFWESKPIGYFVLFIGIALVLRKDITTRKSLKLKNGWSHIGFWLVIFILFIQTLLTVILLNTDAYLAAKNAMRNDAQMKASIGEINGFTILPSGGIQINATPSGSYGSASINLIVKGSEKYKEVAISLEKTPEKDWRVVGVQ